MQRHALVLGLLAGAMIMTAVEDLAYFTFRPRPDQPRRFDQQTAFYHSRTEGVAFMIGGNGAGTTELAMAKVAKFVFETPPPRRDTPFWLLSDDYPTVMETAWKEKLNGHGHIPPQEVDWDRVQWFKSNLDWPFRTPLKPWPDRPHANWMLEFRAYGQGRQRFQGRAIGGFCFIEQFPWGILEEVLRGCREYNFPGSKFCEFTPIDPNRSIEIEEMLSGQRQVPPGWEFYRSNTECALEAGHVTREWFDQFFGLVSDEMRDTRLTGAFANYEGAVYQRFSPLIHLVGDDQVDFPPGAHHARAIDWGAGPDNAFCCLWAYRTGLGQWVVYDEYYSTDQSRTTIDHLCEVQDRWPWPANNPYYGATFADPSGADDIRLSWKLPEYTDGRYETMAVRPANNAVLEGISHVQWLLKPAIRRVDAETGYIDLQPRLLIHRDNCPHLARQMRMYRWLKSNDRGLNPKDARREPLKRDDHAVDALRYLTFSSARTQGIIPDAVRREDRSAAHGVLLHQGHAR